MNLVSAAKIMIICYTSKLFDNYFLLVSKYKHQLGVPIRHTQLIYVGKLT